MLTIDAQVHAYERDHPGRPWAGVLPGPPEVTGDGMVAAMDAVGVDAALLISPFALYRYDAGYALEVHTAHPGRFALIKPFDPTDPAVAETIADWATLDGAVGVRIMLNPGPSLDPGTSGHRPGSRRRSPRLTAGQSHVLGLAGACRAVCARAPEHDAGHRSPGPGAAFRPAGAAGALRRPPQAPGSGGTRQRRREDHRRLHAVP